MTGLIILLVVSLVGNFMLGFYALDTKNELSDANRNIHRLRQERFEALESSTGPVCQCDHAFAFHKDGKCQYRPDPRSGTAIDYFFGKCKCVGYVGPEPLPEFYHPLALEK